jgi:hypothetical protein
MGGSDKKAVSRIGKNKKSDKVLSSASDKARVKVQGLAGGVSYESVPQFINNPSEVVMHNNHNSWIVLGRDRPRGSESGYGGAGETQAASIDLVVGRLGQQPVEVTKDGEKIFVDPDFKIDAARIYISQKTDIDHNFAIVKGEVGSPETRSGIGIKADGIRMIGREGIKLVTGGDMRNSQGATQEGSTPGIDLIAGNRTTGWYNLQPLVKGKNLKTALEEITMMISKLNGIVNSFLITQMKFNSALTHHFHQSPFFGAPTTPSLVVAGVGMKTLAEQLSTVQGDLVSHKNNLNTLVTKHCDPGSPDYINSRFNHTN